jgi:hypothetical protein
LWHKVKTEDERLRRVCASIVNLGIDADLEFLGTERPCVKVLIEPMSPEIVLFAVLVEPGDEKRLWDEKTWAKLELLRAQKVLERVRDLCNLALDRLEVLGENVPDVLVRVLVCIIKIGP